eukprot:2029756-Pyramimonas_sp.AAC.1
MHRVSVAVCREVRGQLFFVDGFFDGDGPVACVKIVANGTRRIRAHFERLVPGLAAGAVGDGGGFSSAAGAASEAGAS